MTPKFKGRLLFASFVILFLVTLAFVHAIENW